MRTVVYFLFIMLGGIAPLSTMAGFQLTGKGEFFGGDGEWLLFRRYNNSYWYLTNAGRNVIKMRCPVYSPNLQGNRYQVESTVSTAKEECVVKGVAAKSKQTYTQTLRRFGNGLMIDFALGEMRKPHKRVYLQWEFNFDDFVGKKILIGKKDITFPTKTGRFMVSSGRDIKMRVGLDDKYDIGLIFISPVDKVTFYRLTPQPLKVKSDRMHNAYRFSTRLKGDKLKYFLCLLKKDEPLVLPEKGQELQPDIVREGVNLIKEGADMEAGMDGFIALARSGFCTSVPQSPTQPVFDVGNPYQGKYSLKFPGDSGKGKLWWSDKSANRVLYFNRIKLEQNCEYTFSAWMRSVSSGVKARMVVKDGKKSQEKEFSLDSKWKRYSFKFKTPASSFSLLGYYQIMVAPRYLPDGSAIWIDAVQLEKGKITDFNMPEKIGFGAEVPVKFKLIESGSEVPVTLRFRNRGKKNISGKVKYVIKDYWENTVKSGFSKSLTVKPSSNLEVSLNLGKLANGYYRGYLTAPSGETEEIIFGVYSPCKLVKKDFHWPLGAHTFSKEPILRKLGFAWARINEPREFCMNRVMPEKDKRNFKPVDEAVKWCEKNGVQLMTQFNMRFTNLRKGRWSKTWDYVPPWAIKSYKTGKAHRRSSRAGVFPSMNAWDIYVSEMVSRYKGKIQVWEVLNEPNCAFTPKEYLPYLKAAYITAKKANPDCIIVGVCSTADFGLDPAPWAVKVIELGGWKYFDVISIHMYGKYAPEETFSMGSDKMLQFLMDTVAAKGNGKKVRACHSEKNIETPVAGYSRRKFNVPSAYSYNPSGARRTRDFKQKGEYMMRETILSSNAGGCPMFWHGTLPSESIIRLPTLYYHVSAHTEYDDSPRPELIAANGLANVIEGRHHSAGQLDWGGINRCALFTGKAGTVAAIWNYKGKAKIAIPIEGNKYSLHNYFGVKTAPANNKGGMITVDLEPAPTYLAFPKLNAEQARAILTKIKLLQGNVMSSQAFLGFKDGKAGIYASLTNKGVEGLIGVLKLNSLPGAWRNDAGTRADFNVARSSSSSFFMPVKSTPALKQFGVGKIKLTAGAANAVLPFGILPFSGLTELKKMASKGKTATAIEVKPGSIVLDGDLADWSEGGREYMASPKQIIKGRDKWRNAGDMSAEFRFRWDRNNLYMAVRVYDDMVKADAMLKTLWTQDALEVMFDLDLSDFASDSKKRIGDRSLFDNDDFKGHFAISSFKRPEPGLSWKKIAGTMGAKIAGRKTANGYILEIAIPWQGFDYPRFTPASGKTIGFDMKLNDTETLGTETEMTWSGNNVIWKSPALWGKMKLIGFK